MGIAQTTPLVTSVFFNDLAAPFAITGGAYGPTNGHYLITPSGDGVPSGMRIKSVSLGCAGTSLTSCKLHVNADAAGTAILGYANGVVESLGTDFVVTWDMDLLVLNANIPAAALTMLSTAAGRFYLQLKPDVNVSVIFLLIAWERVTV